MKQLIQSTLVLSMSILLFSCSSSEISDPDPTPINPPSEEKTTYDKDVKTLINNSCATSACHDADNPQAGLPLTNYNQVRNAAETGNLINRINSSSNPMPPTGQNNTIISIIDQWKNDGYLEN